MKKVTKFALAIMLVVLMAVPMTAPAFAADTEDAAAAGVVHPDFVAIGVLSAGLGIDSWGLATCAGSVTPSNSTYVAYLTVTLQKQNGGSWSYVYSWSTSGTGVVALEAYRYVAHGTYRVMSSATIYSSSGQWLDSASIYSPIRTY